MKLFQLTLISIITALLISGCTKQQELTPEEAKAIAEEAYIYAFPMLDSYKMLFVQAIWEQSPAYVAPFNKLKNNAVLLGPEYTTIVRPNNDTFYSGVWLDLRSEPMVISVPAIEDKRYYSFQLIDLYTHNFDYIGTRKTGFGPGSYAIAGPGWNGEKPIGIEKVIKTECNFALALGRTQVYSPDDVQNVKKVMEGYRAQPLSVFLGKETSVALIPPDFPIFSKEKVKSAEFITYLNFILGQLSPHPGETELLQKFSKIGIGPNKPFDVENLDPEMKKAIEEGIENALLRIEDKMENLGERKNGWMQISGAFGTPEDMQGKYLTRAAAAMFGLFGNTLEEAFYPEANIDEDVEPLDGSKHNYVLHFDKDEIPPVKAFWSLSMYKLPEQLFIENSINRYVISSATQGLKYNKDGSLDVYIQKDSPGETKESNWLPAHDGPFSLQARLYWPDPNMLDPLYEMPAIKKVK